MESDEFAEWLERIDAQDGIVPVERDDVVREEVDSGDATSGDD